MKIYRNFFKHFIDILLTLIGLVIASPLLLIVAMCLAYLNKGSIFFYQERPGKDAKIFNVVKFKTMTDEKDELGKLLPDEKRLTTLGSLIRKLSLDEIPQLINIIKGDMSIVGPRPLLPKYLPLYSPEQMRRHEAKPGITGWAQVNGRNNISWNKKFELDVWYVDNLGFWLDMKVIFLTIIKVFKREDISKEGHATTEAFNGNN